MNEGKHVLQDARYADAQGSAFWRNMDVLRLDEEALHIIFTLIGHGQSRSVFGSFRHFLFHQIARAERIRRLPRNIVAYPSLVRKLDAAIVDVLHGVAERHASMGVRAFHLMKRALFLPKGSPGDKALAAIDSQLVSLKEQLEKVATGEASHQAMELQTIDTGGLLQTIGQQPFQGGGGTSTDNAGASQLKDLQKKLAAQQKIIDRQVAPVTTLSPYPKGVYASWGDAAWRYGVARTPAGIVYGSQLVH